MDREWCGGENPGMGGGSSDVCCARGSLVWLLPRCKKRETRRNKSPRNLKQERNSPRSKLFFVRTMLEHGIYFFFCAQWTLCLDSLTGTVFFFFVPHMNERVWLYFQYFFPAGAVNLKLVTCCPFLLSFRLRKTFPGLTTVLSSSHRPTRLFHS